MSSPSSDPRDSSQAGLSAQDVENLSAYLDHELDDAGTEQIAAALSRRPEVRKEADTLRKTWELLDYLPRPQAPPSFTEQTLTRLNSTKGLLLQQGMKWRRYAIAGWAACLVTAAAFGFWLTYSFSRDPEYVEVQSPVMDVIPVMETHTTESQPASTAPLESRPAKKDFRQVQRLQNDSKQRNDRLSREIWKVLVELRKKATEAEKDRLIDLSRKGGLPYLAAVIELANKYNIPLQDTSELTPPGQGTAPAKSPNFKRPLKGVFKGE